EVFAEAMNGYRFHLRSLAHAAKATACGKWNRARAGEDFGSVVEKNFVHDAGNQSCPVHQRTAFDQEADDFHLTQARQDVIEVRAAIRTSQWHLFDANAAVFEQRFFLFFGK